MCVTLTVSVRGEGSGASAYPLFPIASLTPVSVERKDLRRARYGRVVPIILAVCGYLATPLKKSVHSIQECIRERAKEFTKALRSLLESLAATIGR